MAKTLAQGRKPGSGRKPGKAKTLKEGRKPGSGRRKRAVSASIASLAIPPHTGARTREESNTYDHPITSRDLEAIDALRELTHSPQQMSQATKAMSQQPLNAGSSMIPTMLPPIQQQVVSDINPETNSNGSSENGNSQRVDMLSSKPFLTHARILSAQEAANASSSMKPMYNNNGSTLTISPSSSISILNEDSEHTS
ncbi:hypothetical protein KAFR_0A02810 [Kazachstania africana CBS 2517]|uniref:Uncharacterized protein n=1 Tax=Kazachstania africana (strain ATCC 22294 / BCRC 22015 / CBS 2517 / CECT 1963 / NBRC 1671 / NRRL Y-8276) TaxID=1071382 RepID=H2AMW7_KAZAF|nr:hypothetical protein KAFR_0A02810 [Kazachstania africana CBS 2517]CCF55717.1 hypothetical protein KAFR_0A02810 [Kazachstania africana CBS 2517]